jgi:hypothetical protein
MEPGENSLGEEMLFALKRQMEWLGALSDAFSVKHPEMSREFHLSEFKNLAKVGTQSFERRVMEYGSE